MQKESIKLDSWSARYGQNKIQIQIWFAQKLNLIGSLDKALWDEQFAKKFHLIQSYG